MKAVVGALGVVLLAASMAFAAGGEGENTGCSGQGNPNSPCAPGGAGGGGGENGGGGGGGGSVVVGNIAGGNAAGGNASGIGQGGTGGAGGAGGAGGSATGGAGGNSNATGGNGTGGAADSRADSSSQAGSSSAANSGASAKGSVSSAVSVQVKGDNVPRQAPPAYAPSFSASPRTCHGATSGGVSSPFGGVSFGTSWKDGNCERIVLAETLAALGENAVALALLCQDSRVAAAAGDRCQKTEKAALVPVLKPETYSLGVDTNLRVEAQ